MSGILFWDRVYKEKSRNSSPLMPIPTRWNAGWHSAMEYCVLILQYKRLKSTSLLMHVACLLRDLPSHSINDISYTCKFEYFRECEYEQNEKLYYRMQTDCTTRCVSQNLLNCCMQNCMDKLHNKSRTSRSNGDWRQKAAVDRGVINYVLYSTMRRPCDPQARPSTSFVDNTTTSRGEIF